uniref:triacylglycerol lipase n=1 Tax=Yarrowia yakushimensis TaxID=1527289 RepID=A0A078BRW8_9ASCO|nr:lipase [Yarrowia yakushimensis]
MRLLTAIGFLLLLITQTQAISRATYELLQFHSQLSDIAYCVQTVRGPTQLRRPFKCGVQCRKAQLEGVEVVHTFVHSPASPALTGYMAVDHTNQTKYVVFRGTNSLEDSMLDLSFGHEPTASPSFLKSTCPECKVQGAIMQAYDAFWAENSIQLSDFLYENFSQYSLSVTGHSLGGVAAALLATDLKLQGLDPLLINFGQPQYANLAYAQLVDSLFFPPADKEVIDPLYDSPQRRLYRVTHWNDVFVTLPGQRGFFHSLGEVYISYPTVNPPRRTIRYCEGPESEYCHSGDYNPFERANFLKNHLAYFGWVGYCPYL